MASEIHAPVQDENVPAHNHCSSLAPTHNHKALAVKPPAPCAAPEDPALDHLASPRAACSTGLFLSQPSLLLDTLEDIQKVSPRSNSADGSSDDEDESEADPEAETQRDLLEAESMLRYGLAKLSEITERHGREVIEEHVRVFEQGPDDGIVALSRMLERACSRAPAAPTAEGGTCGARSPSPAVDEAAGGAREGEGDAAALDDSEQPAPADADATSAALAHVADEFSQKVDAVLAAAERGEQRSPSVERRDVLNREELAVLFSEVLLRNALAFLTRCERETVDRVCDLLTSCGDDGGSTGFELLNALLDGARAAGRREGALHARAALRTDAVAEEADGDAACGAAEATASSRPADGASPPIDDSATELLPLVRASDLGAGALSRVMAHYDRSLLALAEASCTLDEAPLLLVDALLKPALGHLRTLDVAGMAAFWQLGERLHELTPGEENGAQLLAQLMAEVVQADEHAAPVDAAAPVPAKPRVPLARIAGLAIVPAAATALLAVLWRGGVLRVAALMFLPHDSCVGVGFFEC